MIIDSHCHLNDPRLKIELVEVLARAKFSGVNKMQTICTSIAEFEEIKTIADNNKSVFASVGVHPINLKDEDIVPIDKLVELSKHKKIISLGETGLDYFHESAPKEKQKLSFLNHIEASRITNLPVVIHMRDCEEDMIELLKREMEYGPFKGVLHCFTGSMRLAQIAIDLGLYISISGIITFKNAQALQNVVQTLPLERLIVETDAPYLAPEPYRGKKNEPAFVVHVVYKLAELLGKTSEEVASATTKNFLELFNKANPD